MNKQPEKLMLIGLDGAIPDLIRKYVSEGKLPNFERLMKEGLFAENCFSPYPTLTPPDWATIVTGAWPGTHGITCFWQHHKGEPLDRITTAWSSNECKAEFIWNAAEKVGKKSIIMNYPTSWPPTISTGIQIDGSGGGVGTAFCLDQAQLYSTEEYPMSVKVELRPTEGWSNISSSSSRDLETQITVGSTSKKVHDKEYFVLIQDSQDQGYNRVTISRSKDLKDKVVVLKVREWSNWISDEFESTDEDGIKQKGYFKFLLRDLSKDANRFMLFISEVFSPHGWSYPKSLSEEIVENLGPVFTMSQWSSLIRRWIDDEISLEMWDYQNRWMGETAVFLMKKYDWNLFFMHAHSLDFVDHFYLVGADPATSKDEAENRQCREMVLKHYQSIDRMIGKIMEAADDKTMIIVVSDHGAVPILSHWRTGKPKNLLGKAHGYGGQLLADVGLLFYMGPVERETETVRPKIDWKRTKAICQRSGYIYINLKGRDPHGIVEPGEEYEQLRDHIISLLYDYTDSETGKSPVALALKREDAWILGLYGNDIGDIVYAVRPEFSEFEHGQQLPTAKFGQGSLRSVFIMVGPGVKKNFVLNRPMWLTDIVPTVCYLMNLPVPRDAEGAIVYQALEDPNAKLKELEALKKSYSRLKETHERMKSDMWGSLGST